MALITAAVVVVYQSHQAATLLRVAEDQNATLARSFANTVWARYAHYLSSLGYLPGDVIRAWPETADLDRQLRQITKGLPVLKIKIFNLDGLTIYSSEWAQIGESQKHQPGVLEGAWHCHGCQQDVLPWNVLDVLGRSGQRRPRRNLRPDCRRDGQSRVGL